MASSPKPEPSSAEPQRSIEQQRAAFALKRIESIPQAPPDLKKNKEFRSYASALPAMIHMNGLGQAAAFCRAKGGTYLELYQILSDWMVSERQPFAGQRDLLHGIVESDVYRYRVAQAEALAFLEWVKKFALAFLPVPAEGAAETAQAEEAGP